MPEQQEYVLPPKVDDAIKAVNKIVEDRDAISAYCLVKRCPDIYIVPPDERNGFQHIKQLQDRAKEPYKRNVPGTLEYAITPNPEGQCKLLYKRLCHLRDSLDNALQALHEALEPHNHYDMDVFYRSPNRHCMGRSRKDDWKEPSAPREPDNGFSLCHMPGRNGACCRPLLCGVPKLYKSIEIATWIYSGAESLSAEEEARLERHGVAGA